MKTIYKTAMGLALRHNEKPKPYRWTKSVDEILASVRPTADAALRIHLCRPRALRDLLGLEAADVVAGRRIRRAAQELGKGLDVSDIIVLGLGAEVAVRHILQQAAAQTADGLVTHRRLLSCDWGSATPRSSGRDACPSARLDQLVSAAIATCSVPRAARSRASGFVP
jgi:hypothetical protein